MMAEEDKNVDADENKSSDENPAMKKALASGWRPEEEWEGPAENWVDYREFNVRGELMGRIQEQSSILNTQKAQIEEQKKALKDLAAMQDQIAQREHDKIMRQLRAAKAEAIEASDGEQVNAIDEEIDKLKAQREDNKAKAQAETQAATQAIEQGTPPEVAEWIANPKNSWYNTDKFLQGVANTIAAQIVQENPGIGPSQVLSQMEERIRKEMPHKFSSAGAVDDGGGDSTNRSSQTAGKRKRTFKDLSQEEQEAARRFEKLEVMTVEEYISSLDAV
jgi:hypothetical protein